MAQVHQHIELEQLHGYNRGYENNEMAQHQEASEEIEQISLPPTDRGKEAWLVLAGCSLIQIPVWGEWFRSCFCDWRAHHLKGYSLAFGVFQEYYGSHPHELGGDSSNVAVIGTTMTVRI